MDIHVNLLHSVKHTPHLIAPLLLSIRCRYSVFTSLAILEFLGRRFTVLEFLDSKTWFFGTFFPRLFVHVPAAAVHAQTVAWNVSGEKSLHGCIIVDVWVRAAITDVSFQGVCFLYSS